MAWDEPTVPQRPASPSEPTRTMAGSPRGAPPDGPEDREWFERVQRPIVIGLVAAIVIAVLVLVAFVFTDDGNDTTPTTTTPATASTTTPASLEPATGAPTTTATPAPQPSPPASQSPSSQSPSSQSPSSSSPTSQGVLPSLGI